MNLEKLNANYADEITTSDSDQTNQYFALYVGGLGDVKVTTMGGSVATFKAVPVGTILPVKVKRIWQNGTTATLIVGLR